jgi:hypothetical protein
MIAGNCKTTCGAAQGLAVFVAASGTILSSTALGTDGEGTTDVLSSDSGPDGPQYVYRGGSKTDTNMTPRPGKDLSGLSTWDHLGFFRPGEKVQKIDVSQLTTLIAVVDSDDGHVSITTGDAEKDAEWASTRGGDTVHPLTTQVQDAVVGELRVR